MISAKGQWHLGSKPYQNQGRSPVYCVVFILFCKQTSSQQAATCVAHLGRLDSKQSTVSVKAAATFRRRNKMGSWALAKRLPAQSCLIFRSLEILNQYSTTKLKSKSSVPIVMKYYPKRYSIIFSQTCVQRNGFHFHKFICH